MQYPVRILIADDHAIVRDALRPLLESLGNAQIVGEANNGLATIALAKQLQPDLLFLDVMMPQTGGLTVLGEVRRWSPDTRIAIFTGIDRAGILSQLMASEVAGILMKSSSSAELQHGLRTIVAGGSYFSAEALALLARAREMPKLTMRERQILGEIVRGRTNADIATVLNISAKTVDNHRTSLMGKLKVHSIVELVAVAREADLTEAAPNRD
jgi:DNA-binding NarL/FixJ family response regulator